jgi:hypothetical protein
VLDDVGTGFEISIRPLRPAAPAASRCHGSGPDHHHYAVVARDNSAQLFPAYITAMATSSYLSGAYLYRNLPEIYRTFDTSVLPDTVSIDPADRNKGQLQRFVEMFGLQFDVLRSFAASASRRSWGEAPAGRVACTVSESWGSLGSAQPTSAVPWGAVRLRSW